MDSGENTDRKIIFCQDTGFGYMVSFFVNIFVFCAPGTIPDKTESFKFITVGFDDVGVINMDNRLCRDPFMDQGQIRADGFWRGTLVQMPSKPFRRIYFFSIFMEVINDIGEEATAGSKNTVGQ